jgi:hypothetical protein
MRIANIAIKRQHIAVFGAVIHLSVENVEISKYFHRKHIAAKTVQNYSNMMQPLAPSQKNKATEHTYSQHIQKVNIV